MTTAKKKVNWWEVDQQISGLETDVFHEIDVQREAIPLVFVPGIMGTRLRRAGQPSAGNGADGLPNMRWDPSSALWMFKNYSGASGAHRKAMLVGAKFSSGFLEPANATPWGDGFASLMEDYCNTFLLRLKTHAWGPLAKIFEFPVYAVGYNWTDSAENAGKLLAAKIKDIIAEAKEVVGFCEKVIVISHSMGGLVSRSASELSGASDSILGIVHGVQPVTGTPAAYWRVKAGFEGLGPTSRVLGNSAKTVTPVLGNMPGGLQLLPNKLHVTNGGAKQWLTITGGATKVALPNSNPYSEIYGRPAIVRPKAGEKPSRNEYWMLIDPDLLNPAVDDSGDGDAHDRMAVEAFPLKDFSVFLEMLAIAEKFHDALGKKAHRRTFCARGVGRETADVIELRVESNWVRDDPYSKRSFRGFFRDADGNSMQAVLQDPAGGGDGTVAQSSAAALDAAGKQRPGDRAFKVEHQKAFENKDVQAFALEGVMALAKVQYESRRHPLGDFPAGPGNVG